MVEDLQSAWLLLVYCAAARANFFLCTLVGIDLASISHSSRIGATLPLRLGGLGLSSAVGCWADCIRMVHLRHSIVARTIIEAAGANDFGQAAQGCRFQHQFVAHCGFRDPFVDNLIRTDPVTAQVRKKTHPSHVLEEEVRPFLDELEEALLRSQGGPVASVFFTSLPTLRETIFAFQPFRLLLLRCLAFPLSAPWCRCGRPLLCRGHHRFACSRAGISDNRGHPMESVMARICREAGARVRTNVMVRDLDLGVFDQLDGRRLEIIADGLPWRGAQLAVDTTLVSPNRASGTARRHAAHWDGVALEEARRKKERKCPVTCTPPGGRSRTGWGDGSLRRQTSFCEVLSPHKSSACLTISRGRLMRRGRAVCAPCWGAGL